MLCRCSLVVVLLLSLARSVLAAPFVNLDFEQATIPPGTPPGFVNASAAFPGWTARLNSSVLSSVFYNFAGAGEPQAALYDSPFVSGLGNVPIMQGRFGAILIPNVSGTVIASLAQLGTVPSDAQSIRLRSQDGRVPPTLFLNGTEIALEHLGDPVSGSVKLLGGDVSAFAGQTVELSLSRAVDIAVFDAVTFSPIPIPEPGMFGTLTLMAFAVRVRVHKRGAAKKGGVYAAFDIPRKGNG